MPRIVPSQVVAYIDRLIPESTWNNLGPGQAGHLRGLLALIEKIPDELLSMDNATYSNFVLATSSINEQFKIWQKDSNPTLNLTGHRSGVKKPAVAIIRDALSNCLDEAPSPATTDLPFIKDKDFRHALRIDIGAVYRAIADGEWKGATVLAGSVIEALLLWAIQDYESQHPGAAQNAATATLQKTPKGALDGWNLHQYIEVANHLNLIKPATAAQLRLAKDFRNLIHPGRVQRLAQKCNRATAYCAVAGVESFVSDFT